MVLFFISILWTLESVMTGVMAAEPQYNPLTSQGGQTTYNVNLLFCVRCLRRLLLSSIIDLLRNKFVVPQGSAFSQATLFFLMYGTLHSTALYIQQCKLLRLTVH